jgi:hypothetical protein
VSEISFINLIQAYSAARTGAIPKGNRLELHQWRGFCRAAIALSVFRLSRTIHSPLQPLFVQIGCDPKAITSNTFMVEWPPKSGRRVEFPEIDRAGFFDLDMARRKVKAGQDGLIDELEGILRKE